jgi:hypothetical protein
MPAGVVRLLILLVALAAPSSAGSMTFGRVRTMTFERLNTGPCAHRQCVLAKGTIDETSLEQLKAFVRGNGLTEGAIVFLDSPGGGHVAGIALGREIRKRGFNTFVSSYSPDKRAFTASDCASACVSMFMGGVERGVASRSRIGLHQLVLPGESSVAAGVTNAQWYMGLSVEHIADMGGDPTVASLALKTPSAGLRWLSRQEMRIYKVITLDTGLDKPLDNLGALSFFDATR